MSSGVLQVFCPVFRPVAGMLDWPAGLLAAGAVVFPVPRLLPIRVSGPGGSRTGRSPAAKPAPQASLTLLAASRSSGGGDRQGVWLWWLRAPWAAPVLAGAWLRSSLRVGPRLAAAGHGAGPRGQRDQSEWRPPRGAGPDTEAITRCPRPGLLTLSPCCCGGGVQGPDVPVAHRVEDVGEQLAGRGDLGDVTRLGAAAGDDGVPGLADRGAVRGALDGLDQRPAQRPVSPAW